MSRRYSDEPINLIHRIPSPEQLSSARPSERSLGQMIVAAGATCGRAVADLFAQLKRWGRMAKTMVGRKSAFRCGLEEHRNEPIAGTLAYLSEGLETSGVVRPKKQTDAALSCKEGVTPLQPAAMPDSVQPEEVAEIRAYLLKQQQDIARLSAQIQELKSLVVSQQQVLIYLGRELEVSSLSSMAAGLGSAPTKRNRPVRQKSGMKDKAVAQ
ncbi:MAG: hypothetical protein ACT4OL_02655 [Nitrospiraceae bacterium]